MILPATVADLKPDPRNPRRISPDAAAGLGVSLRTYGDISGITYNRRSDHLVGGHQRTSQLPPDAPIVDFVEASDDCGTVGHAAVLLPGGRRFALRVVDWDDATERAANIAANSEMQSPYSAHQVMDTKHHLSCRRFTIAEVKCICGFPDDFVLTGSYSQQWERLGNSVPPPMMCAIASAIRDGILKS